jgi:hypothetical protein
MTVFSFDHMKSSYQDYKSTHKNGKKSAKRVIKIAVLGEMKQR